MTPPVTILGTLPDFSTVRAIVAMGVSGTGKSTIGEALAHMLGWNFEEGDSFHPDCNKEKMRAGIPLCDEDRAPWLTTIAGIVEDAVIHSRPTVVTCSALKERYRDIISGAHTMQVVYLYLYAPRQVLAQRVIRPGHFFNPALLDSQLATVERPKHAIYADVSHSSIAIVAGVTALFTTAPN